MLVLYWLVIWPNFVRLARAAIPIIPSPANNSFASVPSSLQIGYSLPSLSSFNITGVTVVSTNQVYAQTVTPTSMTGSLSFIPGALGITRGMIVNFSIRQGGQDSLPTFVYFYDAPVLAINNASSIPYGSDCIIPFTASMNQPVTLLAKLGTTTTTLTQTFSVGDGTFSQYFGSFTIPAATITQTGAMTITFTQAGLTSAIYVLNIGISASSPPSILSPIPSTSSGSSPYATRFALNQNLIITFIAATSATVSTSGSTITTIALGTSTVFSATTTPSLVNGAYIGRFTVPAVQADSTLNLKLTQSGISGSSPVAVFWFAGPPTVVGYSSTASTYMAYMVPAIAYFTYQSDPQRSIQVVLTDTILKTAVTRYYLGITNKVGGITRYQTGSIDLRLSDSYAYPRAGSYSMVATASGVSSDPIAFTIINPTPPTITNVHDGSAITISPSQPFKVAYSSFANYLQPISINFTASSSGRSISTTVIPPASGSGSANFIQSSGFLTGVYTLTALQPTPDGVDIGFTTISSVYVNSVDDPVIISPLNGTATLINSAFAVKYSSAANLQGIVTITVKRPDSTLVKLTDTPPMAGGGSITFLATTINQYGTYSISITQVADADTTLSGSPVIFTAGDIPIVNGLTDGKKYTQDLTIAPIVAVSTQSGFYGIAVSLSYRGTSVNNTYQVNLVDGKSQAGPILLNHPYNFGGLQQDFAALGDYSLSVNANGILSAVIKYSIVAANIPSFSFPAAGDVVTVSAANPFNVTFSSPANYPMNVTAVLSLVSTTRKIRRAGPISITISPDAEGGGRFVFDGDNAPVTSGNYQIVLSQLTPSGSSVSTDPVPFQIIVLAASGAAGGGGRRTKRKLARRSRCNNPEIECPTASGGFECIDLSSELTSCGGCNADGNSDSAFDCTLIKRAKGVGCQQGRCVVYSCEGFSYHPNAARDVCIRQ